MIGSKIPYALFLLLSTGPAVADAPSISGRYLDIEGDPMDITQQGAAISIRPDVTEHDMPDEAKAIFADMLLKGTIETKSAGAFALTAKYTRSVEPGPGVKMDLKMSLAATGAKDPRGLDMKSCEWHLQMKVTAGDQVLADEDQKESCVGIWKKE